MSILKFSQPANQQILYFIKWHLYFYHRIGSVTIYLYGLNLLWMLAGYSSMGKPKDNYYLQKCKRHAPQGSKLVVYTAWEPITYLTLKTTLAKNKAPPVPQAGTASWLTTQNHVPNQFTELQLVLGPSSRKRIIFLQKETNSPLLSLTTCPTQCVTCTSRQ